jgi:hypothetical protein
MSSILTLNSRGSIGLTAGRDYFKMNSAQFRSFIKQHHALLIEGFRPFGISYDALAPALTPSVAGRQEAALIFNIDLIPSGFYGHYVQEQLLPVLGKDSTLSVLSGDIFLTPEQLKPLAIEAGMIETPQAKWGKQYLFCVYLNNLSPRQRDEIHQAFAAWPSFVGLVPMTYSSRLKTILGTMLPTVYIKQGKKMLTLGAEDDWVYEGSEISFPFKENGYKAYGVHDSLFSALLCYKIPSEVLPAYQEDVLVSLSAISDSPMELSGLDVEIPDAKHGYLLDKKFTLLEAAGLEDLTALELAAVIRANIDGGYIYRLQENVDDTVQFTLAVELKKKVGDPLIARVALKYLPEKQALSLVTMT